MIGELESNLGTDRFAVLRELMVDIFANDICIITDNPLMVDMESRMDYYENALADCRIDNLVGLA